MTTSQKEVDSTYNNIKSWVSNMNNNDPTVMKNEISNI